MNIHARLRNKATSPPVAQGVNGQWFNIRLTPDLAAGERLNIGVGLIDEFGSIQTKMLNNFERLRCLYADRIDTSDLEFLSNVLENYWRNDGRPATSPIANITFSELKYASGSDVSVILEDLYRETVALEPSPVAEKPSSSPSETIDDKKARELVFSAMCQKAPFARAKILPDNPQWQIEPGKTLDMPIRGYRRFATLISAWYKSRETLEIHQLRAYANLDTAARTHPNDRGALFILRPPVGARGYDESQQQQIDNVIDMVGWRLKKNSNLNIEVGDSAETLSEQILAWSDIA